MVWFVLWLGMRNFISSANGMKTQVAFARKKDHRWLKRCFNGLLAFCLHPMPFAGIRKPLSFLFQKCWRGEAT